MAGAVNKADVVDGFTGVISDVGLGGLHNVQSQRAFARLRDEPGKVNGS